MVCTHSLPPGTVMSPSGVWPKCCRACFPLSRYKYCRLLNLLYLHYKNKNKNKRPLPVIQKHHCQSSDKQSLNCPKYIVQFTNSQFVKCLQRHHLCGTQRDLFLSVKYILCTKVLASLKSEGTHCLYNNHLLYSYMLSFVNMLSFVHISFYNLLAIKVKLLPLE